MVRDMLRGMSVCDDEFRVLEYGHPGDAELEPEGEPEEEEEQELRGGVGVQKQRGRRKSWRKRKKNEANVTGFCRYPVSTNGQFRTFGFGSSKKFFPKFSNFTA